MSERADGSPGVGASTNRAVREARRLFGRFRNVRPAGILRTAMRAALLSAGRGKAAAAEVPARAERIVISLTTTPARARHIRPALLSLIDQSEPADRIVLALPFVSRSGIAYPDPETMNLPEGIELLRPADEGPATKLLPARIGEPDAVIVVADDDVIYPRNFVATLLAAHRQRPHAAVGYRGVRLVPGARFADLDHVFATGVGHATPVDVLFGTWGYLLPAGVPGPAVHDFSGAPAAVRFVDDVWISGHLARAGIPRYVVRGDEFPIETAAALREALTAGPNRSGENDEAGVKFFARDW